MTVKDLWLKVLIPLGIVAALVGIILSAQRSANAERRQRDREWSEYEKCVDRYGEGSLGAAFQCTEPKR